MIAIKQKLKYLIFIFFIILSSLSSYSKNFITSSYKTKYSDTLEKPKKLPYWTLITPGATYFYQNKIIKGMIFSALEVGGIFYGLKYKDRYQTKDKSSVYANYPLLLGMQAYSVEINNYLRNCNKRYKYFNPSFKYDAISDKELYLAPFKKENIFTPITGGAVLLAGAFLTLNKFNEQTTFSNVDKIYFENKYRGKNKAIPAYGIISMGMSWGAGVSEEYMVRNALMPILDYKFGQKKGLIFSSLIFGGFHAPNALFAENPNFTEILTQVGVATIGGYFLGKDVQNRNYKIGPAVAAHTWYNFTLMLGSFLIDPKDNIFGVDVKFNID